MAAAQSQGRLEIHLTDDDDWFVSIADRDGEVLVQARDTTLVQALLDVATEADAQARERAAMERSRSSG